MSDTKNSNALWGVVITTLGLIFVGVLNNYDKIFPPTPPTPVPTDTLPRQSAPSPSGGSTRPMPPRPQPTAQPAAPNIIITSTVTGRVLDENGQPVAGAKVRCTDCLPPSPAVVTDSDGQFSLPFRVERTHENQDIHLSVSGHKNLHSIRASDPTGRVLQPN